MNIIDAYKTVLANLLRKRNEIDALIRQVEALRRQEEDRQTCIVTVKPDIFAMLRAKGYISEDGHPTNTGTEP